MRPEVTVNDPMIPYSDQVYMGMLLGEKYANYNKVLESGSEAEKDEASRGISRLIVQANTEGWWYSGETQDRPLTEPEPIAWVDFDDSTPRGPRKIVSFDDNIPDLDSDDPVQVVAEPVIVTDPAFDENESDWQMVKTLKGHARNMDALKQENQENWLVESMFGIGLIAGVGAVVLNAEISKALIENTSLVNAPWLLKFLIGSSATVFGSWVLNQKLFLDNAIKKWIAPKVAEGHIKDELSKKGIEDVGGAILASQKRDIADKITSTVVLGDIAGKMIGAGVELVASVGSHLISTARHAYVPEGARPDYTVDYGQLDLPSDHILTGGSLSPDMRGGVPHVSQVIPDLVSTPDVDLPDTQLNVDPTIAAEDLLPHNGLEYVIKPNDQMLQVLLDQHVTDQVYSSSATIDFLKLNQDTLLEAWTNKYGANGVPMRDDAGNWVRYSTNQMRQIIDDVIARGGTPTQEWSQTMRKPFNDIMNALRGIPAGTKVILPEAK